MILKMISPNILIHKKLKYHLIPIMETHSSQIIKFNSKNLIRQVDQKQHYNSLYIWSDPTPSIKTTKKNF